MSEDNGKASGADIGVEIAGQKVNLRNVKSLNTMATLLTMVLSSVVLYALLQHQVDAREGSRAFVEAIKDNTRAQREAIAAQREANCIARLTPDQRKDSQQLEFCRQLGRER